VSPVLKWRGFRVEENENNEFAFVTQWRPKGWLRDRIVDAKTMKEN
jgi:hypothetical protein